MNKKTITIVVSAILTLLIAAAIFITVFLVNPYFTYINTHTWATVSVRGEWNDATDDGLALTEEYLQGDTIAMGDVSVVITDIGSEGTVKIKVQSGNLYEETGKTVEKFTIDLDRQAHFSTDGGTVTFEVISNRYQ